jgi:hypothetical protein
MILSKKNERKKDNKVLIASDGYSAFLFLDGRGYEVKSFSFRAKDFGDIELDINCLKLSIPSDGIGSFCSYVEGALGYKLKEG